MKSILLTLSLLLITQQITVSHDMLLGSKNQYMTGQTNDWVQTNDNTISIYVDMKKYKFFETPYFVAADLSCKMNC